MDDQTFQLLLNKMDDIHSDVKATNQALVNHIDEDRKVWRDVWFVKRSFQAMWGAVLAWLGYLGVKGH